jgi:hypothetical protein
VWRTPIQGVTHTDLENELDKERLKRWVKRQVDAEEIPPTPIPPFTSLSDRLANPVPPVEYRVGDWWPINTHVVFAAQYKAGKTTAVGNLIRTLADGDPWLGRWAPTPFEGNIGLLDFEMNESMLERWLRDQAIQNTHRVKVMALQGAAKSFNVLDPRRRVEWAEYLRANNIAILILDCLRPVLDALGLDEREGVGRFFVDFDEVCREAGIQEVMVVHHMGHSGERSRGDSRIRDWPAVEWTLVRKTDDPTSPRFIKANGRDVCVEEGRINFTAKNRHLTYLNVDRYRDGDDVALLHVLYILSLESDPISGREMQAQRNADLCSERALSKALGVAIKRKWVSRHKEKKIHLHAITPLGRDEMKAMQEAIAERQKDGGRE